MLYNKKRKELADRRSKEENPIEERKYNLQKKLLQPRTVKERLISLFEASKISGVCYASCRKYANEDSRMERYKRYPDQTNKLKQVMWSIGVCKLLQTIRNEGLKKRRKGNAGRRWKWSEEARARNMDRMKRQGKYINKKRWENHKKKGGE